ncbi:MAG: hypothetical protein KJ747_03995 [Actinobacteria bacterium]|nr:hypothetical protein [Actinomycetota bacterium]MCG2807632.1 hypothetical protein [Coriobacteriia bacterium]
MNQQEYANATDAQLETLRDDLARRHSKLLRRVGYSALAFGLASLLGIRFLPIEVFIAVPPIFLVVALLMLAPSFRIFARRADVVRELESRGVSVSTVVSPVTGQPGSRADVTADNELQRRLLLPVISTGVSFVLLLSVIAASIISDAPDDSWLFTATFILFVPVFVCFAWIAVVASSASKARR